MKIDWKKVTAALHPTNPKLFWTCAAYSVFHLALMLHAHFSNRFDARGRPDEDLYLVPYSILIVHTLLLTLYATPKEVLRWVNGGHTAARPGSAFVLLWVLAFTAMAAHQYATRGRYRVPEGMVDMIATMGALLLGSELSKIIHRHRRPCPPEK